MTGGHEGGNRAAGVFFFFFFFIDLLRSKYGIWPLIFHSPQFRVLERVNDCTLARWSTVGSLEKKKRTSNDRTQIENKKLNTRFKNVDRCTVVDSILSIR